MKKDNRPQGGLSDKVVIERLPLPVKVLGAVFFCCKKSLVLIPLKYAII